MSKNKIMLLDCTLRDGGYVNDWKWGYQSARNIIRALVKANIDVVEVGFLRNVEGYNPDVSVCNTIEELNKLLPKNTGNTMFSGMAMRSNYDINKLSPYCGSGIEMIRITAHDYDIEEGMDFAREVQAKGYKLSINPINIMGYSDEKILWILKQVNDIHPYQFSIVDTFGSMKRRDLDRIVSLVDNNLDRDIRVGLHLHENMAISNLLAQMFIDKNLNRNITVDGSLMGMGRIPGNLPIELIASYTNEYARCSYDIDYLMDAIQDYIAPYKGQSEWGYTPAYFLSARYNLHRNYAEHYLKKGDLTHRDINKILARFDSSKKTAFDASYADKLYQEYKNVAIDDKQDWNKLCSEIVGKDILVLAPGKTITTHSKEINGYIIEKRPIVISLNFTPDSFNVDYTFFSNSKRLNQAESTTVKKILTSNIKEEKGDYTINYNALSGSFNEGCNALILLLKLLKNAKVNNIALAGADGFIIGEDNYYNNKMASSNQHGNRFNMAVVDAIRNMDLHPEFITPSAYRQ